MNWMRYSCRFTMSQDTSYSPLSHFRKEALAALSAALIAIGATGGCGKEDTKKQTLSGDITIKRLSSGKPPVYSMSSNGKEYTLHSTAPRSPQEATIDHLYYQLNPNCVVTNEQRDIFRSLHHMKDQIRALKQQETITFQRHPDKSLDGRIKYATDSMGNTRTYLVQKRPNC